MSAFEELLKAIEKMACATGEVVRAFCDFHREMISTIPNNKIKHLAVYGKKARTRKKNLKRLIKALKGGAE